MKIILRSKRHHYVAKFSVFLITAALIAGMVGCGPSTPSYDLTIASTAGGSVTIPGEGTFTYDEGTVVDLVAEADEGHQFGSWTGDVDTIANVNTATTTVTMSGNYSITANFAIGIYDWYDLDAIRDNLSASYVLMNDLDSTTAGYTELASVTANEGEGWQPIGTNAINDKFAGSFNGQGYEICNLFIDRPAESDVGLFGVVNEGGVIENVGVVNGNVSGQDDVGGLVGINAGTVSNSNSTGNVACSVCVGGLVGINDGTVSNSYSTGNVTSEYTSGGLVGWNNVGSTVSNSYSTGGVTGEYTSGGLVGINDGTVSNSYCTGGVTGNWEVGGLVGFNDPSSTVSNSYSTGSVIGNRWVGGLVGSNDCGTVSNSYSTGNVTGNEDVGGLVGYNDGDTVSNSFWDTETSGQATSAGGTGKTTAEMQDIDTFTDAMWDIVAVANPSIRNPSYIWNIVDDVTYPFLSWQL